MNQTEDPLVSLTLPLGSVNFILDALNRNPAQAPVMQVAALITKIRDQATVQLNPPVVHDAPAPEEPKVSYDSGEGSAAD